MKRTWFSGPYIVWMAIFIIVPILLIVYFAFTLEDGSLSLDNFVRFLNPIYTDILYHSILMAFYCTLICLAIGYPAAYFMASQELARSSTIVVLFIIPMWMNFLLRTFAWMTLLEDTGIINQFLERIGIGKMQLMYNDAAVLMGMVYNYLPFMILPLYTVLSKIDGKLVEAAEDLGANRRRVFMKITLPLSVPGIASGVTMVFMPAVTTFVIPRLLGGGMYMLFGDLIEMQFLTVGDWNFGSALSLIMMVMIIISIGILNRFNPDGERSGMW